jgi:hypothetical protein
MRAPAASLIHEVLSCCMIPLDSFGLLCFRYTPDFSLSTDVYLFETGFFKISQNPFQAVLLRSAQIYKVLAYPVFQVNQILRFFCFRFPFSEFLYRIFSFLIYSVSLRILWKSRLSTTLVSPFLVIIYHHSPVLSIYFRGNYNFSPVHFLQHAYLSPISRHRRAGPAGRRRGRPIDRSKAFLSGSPSSAFTARRLLVSESSGTGSLSAFIKA